MEVGAALAHGDEIVQGRLKMYKCRDQSLLLPRWKHPYTAM